MAFPVRVFTTNTSSRPQAGKCIQHGVTDMRPCWVHVCLAHDEAECVALFQGLRECFADGNGVGSYDEWKRAALDEYLPHDAQPQALAIAQEEKV